MANTTTTETHHAPTWTIVVTVLLVGLLVGYAFGLQRGRGAPSGEFPEGEMAEIEVLEDEDTTSASVEVYRNPFEDADTNPFQ